MNRPTADRADGTPEAGEAASAPPVRRRRRPEHDAGPRALWPGAPMPPVTFPDPPAGIASRAEDPPDEQTDSDGPR